MLPLLVGRSPLRDGPCSVPTPMPSPAPPPLLTDPWPCREVRPRRAKSPEREVRLRSALLRVLLVRRALLPRDASYAQAVPVETPKEMRVSTGWRWWWHVVVLHVALAAAACVVRPGGACNARIGQKERVQLRRALAVPAATTATQRQAGILYQASTLPTPVRGHHSTLKRLRRYQ